MSEEKSGKTGQYFVVAIIVMIVALFGVNVVMDGGASSHHDEGGAHGEVVVSSADHAAPVVRQRVVEVDDTQLKKVVAERDEARRQVQALQLDVEKLDQQLKLVKADLGDRERRLAQVQDLIDAEIARSN